MEVLLGALSGLALTLAALQAVKNRSDANQKKLALRPVPISARKRRTKGG